MKQILNKNIKLLLGAMLALSMVFSSCKKDEEDSTPPGKLTVNEVVPTHGGAKIAYTLPTDDDILYVKAKYTTTKGEEIFKAASIYRDTIEVEGFNETSPQNITLTVIDHSKNESEAVNTSVTPLVSHIHLVSKSIQIEETFGGVNISWENIVEKMVHVKLLFSSIHGTDSVMISRDIRNYKTQIKGMDTVLYSIDCIVEDKYENKTPKQFVTEAKPMFEEKIDKTPWTLVSELSANGDEWEGLTVNFWDDVIDTRESPDDNSYFIMNKGSNGGAFSYPMDIVIDFNKNAVVNRFVVWQRDFDYENRTEDHISEMSYYYQAENMRKFDLYKSDDLVNWTLIGNYDIGDPKDDDGNVPPEYLEIARAGHEFILDEATEPFRYLKFSITANYGSADNLLGSEITLFGVDNVE